MSKIQDAELGWRCESDYYVSLANTVLSTHGYGASNELKKTYTGGAIGIEVKATTSNNQTWYGPLIISTIESYAKYTPEEIVTTVSIGGTTWYVSNPSYWGQGQFDSNHLLPLVDLNDAGIDQAIIDDLNNAASLKAVATKIIELAELEILPILSSTGYVKKFIKRALVKNNENIVALIPDLDYDEEPTEDSDNLLTSGVIYDALQNVEVTLDSQVTENSQHGVTSAAIYSFVMGNRLEHVFIGTQARYEAALENDEIEDNTLIVILDDTIDATPTENSTNPITSGGVYTAIHNLVIPPDIYSTTEIKTNKMWIDGKPIYRKCFTGPEIHLAQGWETVTWANVDGLNIDNIVHSYIRGRDSDPVFSNLSYPVGAALSQNDTYLHIVPIYNIIYFDTVVIEYTKTTDQPYSGNSLYYRSGYFGIAVPKTISDTVHFQYAEFSTDDYSATTAFAAMMADAAEHFTFDSVSTPSTRETSLTYGNATAQTYYTSGQEYNYVTLTDSGDYFSLKASTPWVAKYIINSKSIMLSAPRSDNNGSYIEYTAFAFGKMANDAKAGVWSSYYSSNYRQAYSWGMTPSRYEDIRPIAGSTSNDVGLIQSPINGIYQVVYGSAYLEGFYQVDGAIFYIAAGYAIKDE